MARTLLLQCDSGISGDMTVGALLDAGADEQGLRDALAGLHLEGYEVRVSRKAAGALVGCDFDVVVDAEHENHDHDMAWLYGDLDEDGHGHGHHHDHDHEHHRDHDHERGHGHDHHGHHHDHDHEHDHGHDHDDEHHHGHEHDHVHHHDHEHDHDHGHDHEHDHVHHHDHGHDHGHGHHHHEHRNLADIRAIVENAHLPAAVEKRALRIFGVIAEAEAKAHGETVETVHFHEVGAVDSIVDVVAAAWCMYDLGVDEVVVSPLAEGEGHVRSAHGVLPIPVPAVANIVAAHGLPIRRAHRFGELVTPTGAAIAAACRTMDELPETYRVVATGLGTGKRAYDPPSTLRAVLVEDMEASAGKGEPELYKLETEVDDCTGEALGRVIDLLLDAGAREAHFIPAFMKKGRPGYQVEVLCEKALIPEMEAVLFANTTTIGIRRCAMERTALRRTAATVETPYGTALVKRVTLPDGTDRSYPEHDSVVELAGSAGVSYQDALRAVIAACV